MLRTPIALLAGLALFLTAGAARPLPAAETIFYVASDGNDAWSGRRAQAAPARDDGPWATVVHAQKQIRALRTAGKLAGPVTVQIRGSLWLDAPLVFTPADSGSASAPVTFGGDPQSPPRLSGGQRVTGWRHGTGPRWTANLPEVKEGKFLPRQLFVNGRRATRARGPNTGYYHVAGLIDVPSSAPWNKGVDKFRFADGDLKPWKDLADAEVVVFHSWNTSRVRIAGIDTAEKIVRFTGKTVFRPLAWDPQQRYYVENVAELLDEPGEWHLDRTKGEVTYWPLPGEDLQRAEVIVPRLAELVRYDGDPDRGQFVEHLTLSGLSFEHADWSLPPQGHGDPQADVTIPAVVTANGARHCRIENCRLAHVGSYGIWFRRGCQHNQITGNQIYDLGAGAIRLGEPVLPKTDEVTSSHNVIRNNYLHDGGSVYAGAVGLWLAHASDNLISHNEIHSFNYSGMSTGWNWSDTQPTRTLRNTIEYNHVHHVVRGMLSDAGGIYTLGTQTGTVVRNNVFHDIFPYSGKPAMAWGIYFDEGSNGITAENNVVYHTVTGGIMNTSHQRNIIRNNIFALSAWDAAWRWKTDKDPPGQVTRNIFYLTQGLLFHPDSGRADVRTPWDYNLYWRTDGQEMEFYGQSFSQWQAKGLDRHSRVADPRFVDPEKFDFRLKPDSPARSLGIESIDTTQCGLEGAAEWVNLPRQVKFAPTVLPPLPPPPAPEPIDDGFEQTAPGQPPAKANLFEEGKGDSIRVTAETAADGRHSLKFTDAPGLKHVFNPHLYYSPHFRKGRATLQFAFRLEPGAIMAHEWRDNHSPYRVGPSLRIDAQGRLHLDGKSVAQVPTGQWCRLEIVCPLGSQANGKYDLALTVPGQPPQRFSGLACGSPEFKQLEWLGWTALANEKAVFYLDSLKLTTGDQ